MNDLKIIAAIFGAIVLVFTCGLFSLLQALGAGDSGTFWTGIGLFAFLWWLVPIFAVGLVVYFIIKAMI